MGTPDHLGRQFNRAMEMIENIMAAENSVLTKGTQSLDHHPETGGRQLFLESEISFPHVTIMQCRNAPRGA